MSAPAEAPAPGIIRSLIPARIDRLPWSPFHTRMVVALGVAWILDGLEITVAGAVAAALTSDDTLGLSTTQVGLMATVYLAGEVAGALFFGSLADKLGRRKLFIITLAVYLIGSGLTALTLSNGTGWLIFLYVTRFISGMGIGGEYAAINSAIDELIPARYRGRVDIAVNGTYWAGAMIGAAASIFLLDPDIFPVDLGWRIGLLIGPVLGLVIIGLRRTIPESPRWLMTHGREEEAERTVDDIEARVRHEGVDLPPVDESKALEVKAQPPISYRYGDITVPFLQAEEPLAVQDRHFVRCALDGTRPQTDGWNGLAVVEVLDALQLALQERRRVELAEVRRQHRPRVAARPTEPAPRPGRSPVGASFLWREP